MGVNPRHYRKLRNRTKKMIDQALALDPIRQSLIESANLRMAQVINDAGRKQLASQSAPEFSGKETEQIPGAEQTPASPAQEEPGP